MLWGLIFGRAYYQNYTVCCLREREVTSFARIEKNSCNSQSLRWFLTTIISIPTHNKRMHTAPQVAPGVCWPEFSEFDFDYFRSKSPLPFPVKPLPVSTSGRILPRTADLVFDSLLCMFDSFLRFNSCLRSSIYVLPGSIDIGAVGFISLRFALFVCSSIHFVRFDSFVYGSIYFCAGSIQFLCRSIHFLGRSIYFWVVRFIFCCFDIL